MWVYPYEDDSEHVIFNMVNGLLLRPYVSGMVWKLSERSMSLLHEGITLYKRIRNDVKEGVPYWPLGFNMLHDDVLAYGLNCNNKAYLSVFAIKSDTAEIPLNFTGKKITSVNVIYPASVSCDFNYDNKTLKIHMPQAKAARLFEIQFE